MTEYFRSPAFWVPAVFSFLAFLCVAYMVRRDKILSREWIKSSGRLHSHHHVSGETECDILEISYQYLDKNFKTTHKNYGKYHYADSGKIDFRIDPNDPERIYVPKNANYSHAVNFVVLTFVMGSAGFIIEHFAKSK